ncbi:MAG TPA: hypothetical protein VM658_14490 [bacterium]|nr:hypothetical protein [bacterium]
MNEVIGIDLDTGPIRGLTETEVGKVLEYSGLNWSLRGQKPGVPLKKIIYGHIESGYPALVVFKSGPDERHAIPVIGHTFNEDTWVPRAESSYFVVGKSTKYIPSESWVDMFIIHDDNWGSNYCVPNDYFEDQGASVILTLPKQVLTDPIRAEVIGSNYLMKILPSVPAGAGPWAKRLDYYARNDLLVIRPLLISGSAYTRHLRQVADWDGLKIGDEKLIGTIENEIGQEQVWMVELSVPELFSANKRKLGEVILRAEVKPTNILDFSNYYITRLPGYFVLYKSGGPDTPRFQFDSSGSDSHVELYGCEE